MKQFHDLKLFKSCVACKWIEHLNAWHGQQGEDNWRVQLEVGAEAGVGLDVDVILALDVLALGGRKHIGRELKVDHLLRLALGLAAGEDLALHLLIDILLVAIGLDGDLAHELHLDATHVLLGLVVDAQLDVDGLAGQEDVLGEIAKHLELAGSTKEKLLLVLHTDRLRDAGDERVDNEKLLILEIVTLDIETGLDFVHDRALDLVVVVLATIVVENARQIGGQLVLKRQHVHARRNHTALKVLQHKLLLEEFLVLFVNVNANLWVAFAVRVVHRVFDFRLFLANKFLLSNCT